MYKLSLQGLKNQQAKIISQLHLTSFKMMWDLSQGLVLDTHTASSKPLDTSIIKQCVIPIQLACFSPTVIPIYAFSLYQLWSLWLLIYNIRSHVKLKSTTTNSIT